METIRDVGVSVLFPEILAMIFRHLDVRDKGRAAQVCSAWRDAAYHRHVWRGVEAKLHLRRANPSLFPSLVKRGIRRIQILSLRRSLRDVVAGIPNLDSLNLRGCYNVTDIGLGHAIMQDLPTITVLNLSLCKQVTDNSLGRISRHLKELRVLELGGCCNVTSNGLLLCAWGLRRLRTLNLRGCRHISDQGIYHLAGLDKSTGEHGMLELENLVLQDCQKLTDQAINHISAGLLKLSRLNLSFCASVTDTGLRSLARLPHLTELNLRSCYNISDVGVGFLASGQDGGHGGCAHLASLDLSFCERISDASLAHIAQGLYRLQSLSMCACNISDDGIGKLARASNNLSTLNVGQCARITDNSLIVIADNLKNFSSMDVYGCTKITTVGLERLMQLDSLQILNLGIWPKR